FRVDSRLPAGQSDTARLDPEAGRIQSRDAAQGFRQVAEIGKARAKADGVDRVARLRMKTDDLLGGKSRVVNDALQVELQFVTARNAMQPRQPLDPSRRHLLFDGAQPLSH